VRRLGSLAVRILREFRTGNEKGETREVSEQLRNKSKERSTWEKVLGMQAAERQKQQNEEE